MKSIAQRIADELEVKEQQVVAATALLDEGATVPFISRYRKEATGGLDDIQLRNLAERLDYLREMEERRSSILKSIEEQGKLTEELRTAILAAETKTRLEDLYLPYKPKRRTKGQIAIEAGIEPLADALFGDPTQNPQVLAKTYINTDEAFKGAFDDEKGVLEGAKYILMERFVEHADLLQALRSLLTAEGRIYSKVASGKESEGAKYSDYFDHSSPIKDIPSHRALALFRGSKEGILQLRLDMEHDPEKLHPGELLIARHHHIEQLGRAADNWLAEVVRWTWRIKLQLSLETELFGQVRERAEEAAIDVFAKNLKDLLLAAPAGQKATMGLDPGIRTGVKVAVVDATGKFLDAATVYPHAPKNQWHEAIAVLAALAKKHGVQLLAIGNGTASRETDKLCQDLIKLHPQLALQKVMVNEAGASVYSASEIAAQEFPELDVTIRGAISIARRLQDPLAELVKIEPKSIGVGQYQHDVSQFMLAKNLDTVIEDCVNHVGVEVNSASAALLRRVAGLNQSIAENIVAYRDTHGVFRTRSALKSVPRLGEKTFEQAAGFLRIRNGDNPLDASAVHPESYSVVERMAQSNDLDIAAMIGDSHVLKGLKANDYVDERFGLPTVLDIIKELDKPGRDPRPDFKTAQLKEGVETLSDLEVAMILEGTVTNVTNFGAFVDIGVHQDGLVHISALAHRFVKDPREIVKAGDIVKVKVLEVDVARKRIALSMRLEDDPAQQSAPQTRQKPAHTPSSNKRPKPNPEVRNNAFAAAFANARDSRK